MEAGSGDGVDNEGLVGEGVELAVSTAVDIVANATSHRHSSEWVIIVKPGVQVR